AELLAAIGAGERAGSPATLASLAANSSTARGWELSQSWVRVHDFLRDLDRSGMLSDGPVRDAPYPGRSALLFPEGLRELWIQINNACNLTCTHCLVSSGPGGAPGIAPGLLRRTVDRAAQLGLERLYITGGEPFLRRDIFDLAEHATTSLGAELVFLTNA